MKSNVKGDILLRKVFRGLQHGIVLNNDTLPISSDWPNEIGCDRPGHNRLYIRLTNKHLLWIFKQRIAKQMNGILVIGPTGSGKV